MSDKTGDVTLLKDPDDLQSLSVGELRDYRESLKATLDLVNNVIERKKTYRESLDSVFK